MAVITRTARAAPRARARPLAWLGRKNHGWYVLAYVLLAVLSLWTIFPFYWQLATSLRRDVDLYGASRLQALLRIVLPLSGPALVVVAVFAFTLSWNEFLYAFVLIQSPARMTAPVGLFNYLNGDTTYWGQMMAAATVMSAPPL